MREAVEPLYGSKILAEPRLPELGIGLAQVVALELCVRGDLSGEQPAAKRAIGEHHEAVLLGVRKHVLLDLALEQIVRRLDGGERRSLPEAIHLLRRKITDADGADFSLAAKVFESLCRLVERDGSIRPMHLIDVDDIGLEAAKRILELGPQPGRRRVAQDLAA